MDYKKKCHDIYYESDVVNKELTEGCIFDWCNEKMEQETYVVASICGTEDVLTETHGFSMYAYIRKGLGHTELISFDNPFDYEEDDATFYDYATIIGHPPTGFDWLRLMEVKNPYFQSEIEDNTIKLLDGMNITFNLKTGEPKDWEALYNIIK